MPMTPDEVVKVLEEYFDEANVGGQPNKYLIRKQTALQSAISLLQDYQKLRERIDTHKITCIIAGLEFKDGEKDTIIYEHYKDTAQAIVTYLQQPTEH